MRHFAPRGEQSTPVISHILRLGELGLGTARQAARVGALLRTQATAALGGDPAHREDVDTTGANDGANAVR